MQNQFPNNQSSQETELSKSVKQIAKAQGNINQSARDLHYRSEISTRSTNVNLWISFFLIGILALGGLAWALNVGGLIKGYGSPQVVQPSVFSAEKK
jgi:hypothetical protein